MSTSTPSTSARSPKGGDQLPASESLPDCDLAQIVAVLAAMTLAHAR
ncbi:hypothetical protein [Nonomuraea basaltis]|nr:hypothetical protein [Nonomuraea basaltis]